MKKANLFMAIMLVMVMVWAIGQKQKMTKDTDFIGFRINVRS